MKAKHVGWTRVLDTSSGVQLLEGRPGRCKVLCGFDIPVLDAEEDAAHVVCERVLSARNNNKLKASQERNFTAGTSHSLPFFCSRSNGLQIVVVKKCSRCSVLTSSFISTRSPLFFFLLSSVTSSTPSAVIQTSNHPPSQGEDGNLALELPGQSRTRPGL